MENEFSAGSLIGSSGKERAAGSESDHVFVIDSDDHEKPGASAVAVGVSGGSSSGARISALGQETRGRRIGRRKGGCESEFFAYIVWYARGADIEKTRRWDCKWTWSST